MRVNSIVIDAQCTALGLSNRELARRIGKSPQFVLRLRRGDRTASLGTIELMAKQLNAPLETLMLPHRPVVREPQG